VAEFDGLNRESSLGPFNLYRFNSAPTAPLSPQYLVHLPAASFAREAVKNQSSKGIRGTRTGTESCLIYDAQQESLPAHTRPYWTRLEPHPSLFLCKSGAAQADCSPGELFRWSEIAHCGSQAILVVHSSSGFSRRTPPRSGWAV